MEFITGILLASCVYLLWDKFKRPKIKQPELTDDEKQRTKDIDEHFQHMMNYDIKKAYGGK